MLHTLYQAGSLTQTVRKDDPSQFTIGKFWNFNKKVLTYLFCLVYCMLLQPCSFSVNYSLETKMLKLTLVMATILLHVAASQPVDVNVEVTANGVKIPIGLDQPGKLSERAGMLPKRHLAHRQPTESYNKPKDRCSRGCSGGAPCAIL